LGRYSIPQTLRGKNIAGETYPDSPARIVWGRNCRAGIPPDSAEATMKFARAFRFLMVLSLVFYVYGCSGRPTDMIQKAEQARAKAMAEYAEQFAPDDWSAAEKAWQDASAKLDANSNSEAYTLLLKAQKLYEKANSLAQNKREAAVKAITNNQGTAKIRLKELADHPDVKKLSAARKMEFDSAVKRLGDNIDQVNTQMQNGRYNEASLLIGRTLREIWESQQEFFKK
jgi:hypothetical protein